MALSHDPEASEGAKADLAMIDAALASLTSPPKGEEERDAAWEEYRAGRPFGDVSRQPAFNAGWLAAQDKTRNATLEEAAKVCDLVGLMPNDCECLGITDPTTGVAECSAQNRGGDCLCTDRIEQADSLSKKIRALKSSPSKAEG